MSNEPKIEASNQAVTAEDESADGQSISTWTSLCEAVDSLSTPAKIHITGCSSGVFGCIWVTSPATAACMPILALPTLLMVWRCFRASTFADTRPHFESLVWTFFASGNVSVALVVAVQSALSYAAAYLLFGSGMDSYLEEFGRSSVSDLSDNHKQARADLAWTWQNFTFLFLLAFSMAGLIEEAMKYLTVTFVRHRSKAQLTEQHYIAYIIACSLGLSTFENLGFIYTAARSETKVMLALTVLERTLLGVTGHAMMGVLTAIRMTRRDTRGESLGIFQTLGPAVLYHGTFDFVVFLVSAMDGNVGWIHPTKPASLALLGTVAIGVWAVLALQLRSELMDLRLKT